MPIKSGFYFIMNVQAKNLAYLPNANSEEPVQCRYPRNDPGEQWEVIDRKNGQHSIVNIGYKAYAASGFRSPAGKPVFGWQSDQTWLIQKTKVKGQYIISTTDTQKFWGVADIEQGTPIALADVPTNPFNWWVFKDVETGNDAEVADSDTIPRAVFLFELAPPPMSLPKPFELDLVIIREMPNNFIRNVTKTAHKICSPLIRPRSDQLNYSDLLIQVIEFESVQEAYRFRYFGPDSFDNLRLSYQGVDCPLMCPEPMISSFLTKGMDGFRPSATKVIVLNLRYIPPHNGEQEQLRGLIDRMIKENIILILTLSEPHQSDAPFATDLFQELARPSSVSILSLPADREDFYPCIVDYLQCFNTDSIANFFSNVVTIDPENFLKKKVRPPSSLAEGTIQERPTKPSTSLPPVAPSTSLPSVGSPPDIIKERPTEPSTSLPPVAPPHQMPAAIIMADGPLPNKAPAIRAGRGNGHTSTPRAGEPLVILRLRVLGCANLMEEELLRGTRYPYVVVNFLNNRGETPFAKGTSNPIYAAKDATFDFPIYFSLADRLGVIELVIWNKDVLKQLKDDCLGKVALPLEHWFNDRDFAFDHPGNKPFMLNIISTRTGRPTAGRIHIKLGFAHASSDHIMEFPQIYRELCS